MKIVRDDFDGYYVLQAVDENGKLIWRSDGTARYADSREVEFPEQEVRRAARPQIKYSNRGIV